MSSARGGKKRAKMVSRSVRAGVLFPVARMLRYLKRDTHHVRIGSGTPVYMAAVIEYLTGLAMYILYLCLHYILNRNLYTVITVLKLKVIISFY